MNTPTQAGQAEAARRSNEVAREFSNASVWSDRDFEERSRIGLFVARTIACDELLAKDAELATAKAALGEMHRLLKHALSFHMLPSPSNDALMDARDLAAPYAVATDPLVEAFPATANWLRYHETGGHEGDGSDEAIRKVRAELSEISAALRARKD